MTSDCAISTTPKKAAPRPAVTSYDSGYEHSLEHLVEVRRLVDEAEQESPVIPEWYHATA